jgi:hypothetical protein
LCSSEKIPLSVEETIPELDVNFVDKLENKTRQDIITAVQDEYRIVSKGAIDFIIKQNFKKIKNSQGKFVYISSSKADPNNEK